MIRAGFLTSEDRTDLIALAKDGSAAHRLARRANAIALLDAGYNFEKVAEVLYLDDGTIRAWHKLFVEGRLEGLTRFEAGGSACQMRAETGKRFDSLEARFDARLGGLEADMQDLKKDLRGLKVQTIAEIYKANLTVASFADLDQRR